MPAIIPSLLALSASLLLTLAHAGESAGTDGNSRPVAASSDTRPVNCLQDTGSRIKRKAGSCLPLAGRTHRADDLRATGATSAAEALQDVDPSLRAFPGR